MTIGTVVPHTEYNCVRNVTFSNHTFYHPFKAVYVKNNPGHTDTMLPGSGGEISNVLYENLEIHEPIWWGIYIGLQQQKQPHSGNGPGCMLYPLKPCETSGLVSFSNFTLSNINIYNAILPPGVIRCNETSPCTGFEFNNVHAHGWWKLLGLNYIVENVQGTVTDSRPKPAYVAPGEEFVSDDDRMIQLAQKMSDYFKNMIGEYMNEKDETQEAPEESASSQLEWAVSNFRELYTSFTAN